MTIVFSGTQSRVWPGRCRGDSESDRVSGAPFSKSYGAPVLGGFELVLPEELSLRVKSYFL